MANSKELEEAARFLQGRSFGESLILLTAANYALADAQTFDWLVDQFKDYGITDERLSDLREELQQALQKGEENSSGLVA